MKEINIEQQSEAVRFALDYCSQNMERVNYVYNYFKYTKSETKRTENYIEKEKVEANNI
jgi:hypothetical protein